MDLSLYGILITFFLITPGFIAISRRALFFTQQKLDGTRLFLWSSVYSVFLHLVLGLLVLCFPPITDRIADHAAVRFYGKTSYPGSFFYPSPLLFYFSGGSYLVVSWLVAYITSYYHWQLQRILIPDSTNLVWGKLFNRLSQNDVRVQLDDGTWYHGVVFSYPFEYEFVEKDRKEIVLTRVTIVESDGSVSRILGEENKEELVDIVYVATDRIKRLEIVRGKTLHETHDSSLGRLCIALLDKVDRLHAWFAGWLASLRRIIGGDSAPRENLITEEGPAATQPDWQQGIPFN